MTTMTQRIFYLIFLTLLSMYADALLPDLQKRPLSLYIRSNAPHAQVHTRDITVASGDGSGNATDELEYRIARPPFLIKQRGSILLLFEQSDNINNTRNSTRERGDRSLVQLLAASGHATASMQLSRNNNDAQERAVVAQTVANLIGAEQMRDRLVVVGMDTAQLMPSILDHLDPVSLHDAVVVLSGSASEDQVAEQQVAQKLEQFRHKHNIDPQQLVPLLVVLRKRKDGDQGDQGGMQTVELDWDPQHNPDKLAQLMVNLMDVVHPR